MDGYRDLRMVLTALRAGRVDPARLAEVGLGWSPGAATPFWEYLVERGVVAPDSAAGPGPATTVYLPPPVDTGEETPSFADSGATPPFPAPSHPAWDTVAFRGAAGGPTANGPPTDPAARYDVLRKHREGGLGEVWLARDTTVGREVALKRLRPDRADDPDLRARFVREARTTGQLEHPCIVPLYDLIEDAGDRGPCYVMRFVAGRTLAEAVADYHARRSGKPAGRLELAALLDAFVAVCRAVAYAHVLGVLHRDLKGQNVVLGDFGEVFLLDWGLAKPIGEADAVPTPVPEPSAPADPDQPTRTGSLIGTPAYMAPEVAAGGPASKASDVYGLGAVLYSILAGKPPYDGADPWTVVQRVIATEPSPPRAINPGAPPALEAVCRRAMARDPASRYRTADELATEVRRWLADEPVAAYRDPWTVRATRWARRHRTTVAAATVFLLTALVALSVSAALVWQEERRTAEQKRVAELRSDALAELTGRMIEVAEAGLAPVPESEPARVALITAALDTYHRILADRPDDPAVRFQLGMLHRYRGNLYRLTDRVVEAEGDHQAAVALLQPSAGNTPVDPTRSARFAEARVDHAVAQVRAGRLTEATDLLTSVARDAPDPRMSAYVQVNLAEVEAGRGRWAEADRAARQAADLYRRFAALPAEYRHPYDPVFLALAVRTIAAADRARGSHQGAADLAAAIDQLTRLAAEATPGRNRDDVRNVLSRCLVEQAMALAATDLAAAERAVSRAIEHWDVLADRHPQIRDYRAQAAHARQIRGRLRLDGDRPTEARSELITARDVLQRLTTEVPLRVLYTEYLAAAYVGLGRLARAERDTGGAAREYERAVALLRPAAARSAESAAARQLLTEAEQGVREAAGAGRR